jgi:hypothetical protein
LPKLKIKIMEDYYKEELECAHMYLDDLKIPREDDKDLFSLVGRIKQLEKRYLKQMSDIEEYYLGKID